MNRILLLTATLFACLSAQADLIKQEAADNIVLERMSQETQQYTIYAQDKVQEKITITSIDGEVLEVNYKFWCYYVSYTDNVGKYLLVKESNGNLMEVNVKGDAKPDDLEAWRRVEKNVATGTIIGVFSHCFVSLIVQVDEKYSIGTTYEYIESQSCITMPGNGIYNNVIQVQRSLPCLSEEMRIDKKISFSYRTYKSDEDEALFSSGRPCVGLCTGGAGIPVYVIMDSQIIE